MKEDIDVQGFRYPDAPGRWMLEIADEKVTSLQLLLAKFRVEWKWRRGKPLAIARDPVNSEGKGFYDPLTNWIVMPYTGQFYFVIERKLRDLYGPHAARLYYKSYQIEQTWWVAICQLQALWHSDIKMLAALQDAVRGDELYQSEETQQTIVTL